MRRIALIAALAVPIAASGCAFDFWGASDYTPASGGAGPQPVLRGEYVQLVKLIDKLVGHVDRFAVRARRASDGRAAAQALREFTRNMTDVNSRMNALADKYPNLDRNSIRSDLSRMQAAMDHSVAMVIDMRDKYETHPEVKQAVASFMESIGL